MPGIIVALGAFSLACVIFTLGWIRGAWVAMKKYHRIGEPLDLSKLVPPDAPSGDVHPFVHPKVGR